MVFTSPPRTLAPQYPKGSVSQIQSPPSPPPSRHQMQNTSIIRKVLLDSTELEGWWMLFTDLLMAIMGQQEPLESAVQ